MRAKPKSLLFWAAISGLAAALLMAAGCGLPSTKPPVLIKKWTLEYPPPPAEAQRLPAELKVKRFQAVPAYLGSEMIYRPAPNERGLYHYNRWLASPADLVGDALLRDLRAQNALNAVFSNRQFQRPRFVLEGGVEEFMEVDDGESHASLKVTLTLMDTKQAGLIAGLLLQRDYKARAPMAGKGPDNLAKAMSQAMAKFSAMARADILKAIEKALQKPLPKK